ncbi:MAG: hypothetical protein P3X22_005735 [Thermoprotei archaeon]|nr:hypothetical protein [Thermoprotei archaeon]
MPLIVRRVDARKHMSIFRVPLAYRAARGSPCVSPRFHAPLLEPATPGAGLAPLIEVSLSNVSRGML